MTKLLRLTGHVINTKWITSIIVSNDVYKINVAPIMVDGFWILGNGSFTSATKYYVVDKNTHPTDFEKVKKWIGEDDA